MLTPAQREYALRLADSVPTGSPPVWTWVDKAAALLRELAAEPQSEPVARSAEGDTMTPDQRAAALRLAETLEKVHPHHGHAQQHYAAAALLRELAAEPQAWSKELGLDCGEAGHAEGRCGNAACLRGPHPTPRPLTDEQIRQIVITQRREWTTYPEPVSFARAIEAAHGIGEQE